MPAMIVVSFPAGFTAPDATRVLGRSTCSPINRERPVCSASSSTGTKPAADTRFCSSNTADPTANVCDDCTENAFRRTDNRDLSITIVPVQKAFSLFTRRSPRRLFHGSRLSGSSMRSQDNRDCVEHTTQFVDNSSYPSRNSYYSLSQHFSRSFKCRYAGR